MSILKKTLEEHLDDAAAFHGGDCPGQTLGVRLARAGLEQIGIDDPLADRWRKNIMVYVEIDRCAADALMIVTGCRVGKRTLKLVDYGIMAATFINLKTGKAVRVIAREEARSLAPKYAPQETNKYGQQRQAYRLMPDEELLSLEEVKVTIPPQDLPGSPISRVICERCGDHVVDMREVKVGGAILCRPCARGGYFSRTAPRNT